MSKKRGRKRERSQEELECRAKKAKNEKGFLLYDIPEQYSVEELKKICGVRSFIPTCMGKHVKILYYVSNRNDKGIISSLQGLVRNSILKFNPYQTSSRDAIILELESISDEFHKLIVEIDKIPASLSPKNLKATKQINGEIQNALVQTKRKCLGMFARSYTEIMQAFICLEKEKTPVESQDIDVDDCIWVILYCIIWFFAYKISLDNLTRYSSFLETFKIPRFINDFSQSDRVVKVLTVDIFWQLIFLEDQFVSKSEVIDYLNILVLSHTVPLKIFSPDLSALLSEILQTKLVTTQIKINIEYQTAVANFLSNIYLISFPSSLQGITVFNGYVVIKKQSHGKNEFRIEPVHRGFTLLTILHEFGHFVQRISMNTNMQWLNDQIPEYVQRNGANKRNIKDAGSILITKIFGYELNSINISASEYLLDINNWNKKKSDFQAQFASLSNNNEGDVIKHGKTLSLRLRHVESSSLSLIGCNKCNRV